MISEVQRDDVKKRVKDIITEDNPETVRVIIDKIKDEYKLNQKEILEIILELKDSNHINFERSLSQRPENLYGYIISPDSDWFKLVIISIMGTLLTVYTIPASLVPLIYLRYAFSLIFIMFVPGYSFIRTLYLTDEITNFERITYSLGTSLIIAPLMGLLLNYIVGEIGLNIIIISITIVTLLLSAIALYREYNATQFE